MAGDEETGVTIIELVKELDAGPIAAQESFPIEAEDDAGAVFARAAPLAVELLDDVLDDPDPAFRPQPDEGVTYADKIGAADRVLDLVAPARELVNQVRALSPHIGARAELHDRDVTVWRARSPTTARSSRSRCSPTAAAGWTYDAWLRGLRVSPARAGGVPGARARLRGRRVRRSCVPHRRSRPRRARSRARAAAGVRRRAACADARSRDRDARPAARCTGSTRRFERRCASARTSSGSSTAFRATRR